MNAEIIAVGTELLLGEIVNIDAQILSRVLSELGINVYYHTVVGDNEKRLAAALEVAKGRSDIIITTGGLGPTYDDITKRVVAASFGKKLIMNDGELEKIRGYFKKTGREMSKNNESQALLPEGCTVLENDFGTAPGCAFEANGMHVLMLPGPPRECEPMAVRQMAAYLKSLSDSVIVSHSIHIFGIGESLVEDKIRDLAENMDNPTLAPYAKPGEVMLRVAAKAETRDKAEAEIWPVIEKIKRIFGSNVYGIDSPSLSHAVSELLLERGKTLAAAESCTGGYISKLITDVPGASKTFLGGITAYSNKAKEKLLGIPRSRIDEYGAVSEEIASDMARAAAETLDADIGVGITGYAGPDPDSKDTGTVFVSLFANGEFKNIKLCRPGGRDSIRYFAALSALNLIRQTLEA
jgi:nicotinamide-nucleotide amidase